MLSHSHGRQEEESCGRAGDGALPAMPGGWGRALALGTNHGPAPGRRRARWPGFLAGRGLTVPLGVTGKAGSLLPGPLSGSFFSPFSSAGGDLPALAPLRSSSPSSITTASIVLLSARPPRGCGSNLLILQIWERCGCYPARVPLRAPLNRCGRPKRARPRCPAQRPRPEP